MKIETKHSKMFFYFICFAFLALLVYTIMIYSNQVYAQNQDHEELPANFAQATTSTEVETTKEKIEASTFVIYDIRNEKIIRSQNALTQLPIASLTKIITVGTFLDTAKRSNIELRPDTKAKIKSALVQSSNKDADILGYIYKNSFDRDLLEDSNKFIQSLGITDLRLTNLTGLDNTDGTASNVGSASAVAKIFAYVYQNYRDVFEYTKFDEIDGEFGKIKNTNQQSEKTFGIMASKTGFTFEAGGNLGVIVSPEPGSAYVVLVMKSTKAGRFTDVEKIVKLLPLILKN